MDRAVTVSVVGGALVDAGAFDDPDPDVRAAWFRTFPLLVAHVWEHMPDENDADFDVLIERQRVLDLVLLAATASCGTVTAASAATASPAKAGA